MALYLVVAHQTAASSELLTTLHSLVEEDKDAEFVLLVPATPGRHLWVRAEDDERESAWRTADAAANTLRGSGLVVVRTRIGPANPVEAVQQAIQDSEDPYEAVIVSTLPAGISRWLRQGLANQIRQKLGLRVISVTARPPEGETHQVESSPPTAVAEPRLDYLSLEVLSRFRGSEVNCLDGPVGRMTELLYDYASLEPVWIAIASKPLPFRTLLLPATLARLDKGNLLVRLSREHALGQPHVDIGEGIPSLLDEEGLYRYFGLPQASIREVRVLHRYDHLPGMERNWQNILTGEEPQSANHAIK